MNDKRKLKISYSQKRWPTFSQLGGGRMSQTNPTILETDRRKAAKDLCHCDEKIEAECNEVEAKKIMLVD